MKAQIAITLIAEDGKKDVRLIAVSVPKQVEDSSDIQRDEWIFAHALPELARGEALASRTFLDSVVKKGEAKDA
jgi:hypothetical protein